MCFIEVRNDKQYFSGAKLHESEKSSFFYISEGGNINIFLPRHGHSLISQNQC